jgi:hypothetical protein
MVAVVPKGSGEYDDSIDEGGARMAIQSAATQRSTPAHERFHVVKQCCLASRPETVTVLHQVPTGAEELASFENPNQALDFAEAKVQELQAIGSAVELVDPPYGLVGTG